VTKKIELLFINLCESRSNGSLTDCLTVKHTTHAQSLYQTREEDNRIYIVQPN